MSPKNTSKTKKEIRILTFSVFIAGVCSIIYELLIGTVSSYFLGDSIKQFSLVIGVYMASMGLGSYLSRFISESKLMEKFVCFEILLGLLGGLSVPILYFSFAFTNLYVPIMVLLTTLIGLLIGLEIPFLTRIMERYYTLKVNLSNVLSLDYLGALLATLIFPLVLLPFMGTFRSSLFFGILNMTIGISILIGFSQDLKSHSKKILGLFNALIFLLLVGLFFSTNFFLRHWTNNIYQDRVVYACESKYQNIVLTKNKKDLRLFLNGNLQFSTSDEYRYHEALVHIPQAIQKARHVLVLGGGDGLGVRELLKYDSIDTITLVDLDPTITKLAQENPHLKKVNKDSLSHPKVKVVNQDAHSFLSQAKQLYNLIIADLPDPNNTALARLYSKEFYQLIKTKLDANGVFVTQSTSPFFALKAFWSIEKTILAAGFNFSYPYHINVPSFGEWGFIIASKNEQSFENLSLSIPTVFLTNKVIRSAFSFPKDLDRVEVEESTIDNPIILQYYLKGWKHWS